MLKDRSKGHSGSIVEAHGRDNSDPTRTVSYPHSPSDTGIADKTPYGRVGGSGKMGHYTPKSKMPKYDSGAK